MMNSRYTKKIFILEIVTVLIALICLSPFYFLIVNALKPIREILIDPSAFPKSFYTTNFIESFKALNFPKALMNSLIITVATNVALVVISSMAAYQLVRNDSPFSKFLFLVFISAMVIPFQSIMIPMVKMASILHLVNSYYGVVFVYLGFGVSFTMFLFHGFIKSIPLDIEEAAVIDGCTPLGVFWKIVFPLLKPVIVTVIILNGLWIWNDFLLPFLIIPGENMRTIPLAINSFFSQYAKKWDLAMAGLLMAVIPVIILFLSLQKYVIEGIVSGSVKG
jgi:raffinose/stachyose/melibiose transport system permease protein